MFDNCRWTIPISVLGKYKVSQRCIFHYRTKRSNNIFQQLTYDFVEEKTLSLLKKPQRTSAKIGAKNGVRKKAHSLWATRYIQKTER